MSTWGPTRPLASNAPHTAPLRPVPGARPALFGGLNRSPAGALAPADVEETLNWAGQVQAGGQFSGVSGRWTVPTVAPSGTDLYTSTWIGIDGDGNSSLIQTGTEEDSGPDIGPCSSHYFAWVEILPAPAFCIGAVSPGDVMSASINETSPPTETAPATWEVSITDVTSGNTASGATSYDGPGASAEWITEAPEVNGILSTLADFGTVNFSDLGVTGTGGSLVTMAMANTAAVEAYPTAYQASTDAFSVVYGPPPAPQVTSITPSVGSTLGGTWLTIRGSGLSTTVGVRFGGYRRPHGVYRFGLGPGGDHAGRSGRDGGGRRGDPGWHQRRPLHLFDHATGHPPRVLAGRRGRRHLQLRGGQVLRLDRQLGPPTSGGRDHRVARPRRLPAGGLRRRAVRLRGLHVLRVDPGPGHCPGRHAGAARQLNAPIIGMVSSADGAGYFMVGGDGGVFAFGDAKYFGSCPGIGGCSGTAVSVMPDATGQGYWLVTATGAVYAFGDAPYDGSVINSPAPVSSAVRTPDGGGYWILLTNGDVYSFGDAVWFGAPAGQIASSDSTNAIAATADGGGYWVDSAHGVVFAFGDAPDDGDMSGYTLNAPVIAAAGW